MYVTNASRKLVDDGFRVIGKLCSHSMVTDASAYTSLYKHLGNMTYYVVFINCDVDNFLVSAAMTEAAIMEMPRKKILIQVFVTKNVNEMLLKIANKDIDDYNSDMTTIKWIADTSNKEIKVIGNQPSKVLGMGNALNAAFDDSSDAIVSVDTLNALAKNIENSYIKTEIPLSIYVLIAINFLFWLISLRPEGQALIDGMALNKPMVQRGEYLRLFTYMFVHGGFFHLLCNSCSMMIMGRILEKRVGHWHILASYFISGIVAAIFSYIGNPTGISVGASGAIFGLIGFMLVLTQRLKKSIDGFDAYSSIVFAVASVAIGFTMPNIDNYAHIGGLICGIVYGLFFKFDKRG